MTHTAGITVNGFPGYQQTDSFPEIIDVLNGKGNTVKIVVDTTPEVFSAILEVAILLWKRSREC